MPKLAPLKVKSLKNSGKNEYDEEIQQEIERQAAKHGIVMPVLAEINIGGEASKSGIEPEKIYDFCDFLASLPHLKLRGLMAVPPKCEKSENNREYFCKMKKIFIDISCKNVDNSIMDILSLGMSDDYLTAVDCGSNLVRVGSSIFGTSTFGISTFGISILTPIPPLLLPPFPL